MLQSNSIRDSFDVSHLVSEVVSLAEKAGQEVLDVYGEDDVGQTRKADDTPLTRADTKANEVICQGLRTLHDAHEEEILPILSEENKEIAFETRRQWNFFWLVDPLDGTKEFINKNGEFTINIALVAENRPLLGVVHAPAVELTYAGILGEGAYRRKENGGWIKLNEDSKNTDSDTVRIVASRSHLDDETQRFIDTVKQKSTDVELTSAGSSLKFCLLADGEADIYPRLAPTMEWDTGAAQAIVEASGGYVLTYDHREPLVYNKEDVTNPTFIAVNAHGAELLEQIHNA